MLNASLFLGIKSTSSVRAFQSLISYVVPFGQLGQVSKSRPTEELFLKPWAVDL